MVVSIVGVLTALEQRAELDRLVGLVVMHGPGVQTDQPQREPAASAIATTRTALAAP